MAGLPTIRMDTRVSYTMPIRGKTFHELWNEMPGFQELVVDLFWRSSQVVYGDVGCDVNMREDRLFDDYCFRVSIYPLPPDEVKRIYMVGDLFDEALRQFADPLEVWEGVRAVRATTDFTALRDGRWV